MLLKSIKKDRRYKIYESDYKKIRALYAKGYTMDQLADKFGVCRQRISQIINVEKEAQRHKDEAKKSIAMYRKDKAYRERFNLYKRQYYYYKKEVLKNYTK